MYLGRGLRWFLVFSLCIHSTTAGMLKSVQSREEPRFSKTNPISEEDPCNLNPNIVAEIQGYTEIATEIREAALNGHFKGHTYDELAKFVDKFVNRLTGSPELEASIDYILEKMRNEGFTNVRGENVEVPHWIRGEEHAVVTAPFVKKLNILGLGPSVGTPMEGISAEVIVVRSFEELDQLQHQVPGKIVVYNQGWLGSYGATSPYRGNGPINAAKYGAVASLIESVTPYSLDTPHTGGTNYEADLPRIPAACITREDADLLYRAYRRGETIVMNLTMLDEELGSTVSRNAMGELRGTTIPDEIVMVSAHIDAWDVGQGALDDAGGVILATEAMVLLESLGLRPRRTLQAMAWTAEEFGLIGAAAFVNQHQGDLLKYNAAFEADSGVFRPTGIDFAGTQEAGCIVQEVLKLLEPLNATIFTQHPTVGSDISYLIGEGVPGLSLANENEKYFYFHHSPADMLNILDPVEMDMNVAVWATLSYVLADLSVSLPREIPNQK